MAPSLAFHGAARTVTGSRYLLTGAGSKTLIDSGLFQGRKDLRLLNWRQPPFDPATVDQVLLTHVHIDHSGALPRLHKQGFRGPIYCSEASLELARLLLLDAAKIQEEDAEYANRKGFSRHDPALPLYTSEDAKAVLNLFKPVAYDSWAEVAPGLEVRFRNAGHILGAASLELRLDSEERQGRVVFSGDVGRYDVPLHVDPEPLPPCDVLVTECTYGDRLHDPTPLEEQVRQPFLETFERGGIVLIPAFAVGRAQLVTLILRKLMDRGALPEVPIHIDSPMAVEATRIYGQHLQEEVLDEDLIQDGRLRLFPGKVSLHRSVAQSKKLNDRTEPRIIVSSSGMLSGGRVLHHFRRLAPDRRNLIVLAGYQAAGTRGRDLLEGTRALKMHGQEVPVRADCLALHGLSAHGDREELLRWMRAGDARPRQVFLTHGEPEAAQALAHHIKRRLGWAVEIPLLDESFDLGPFLGDGGPG